MAKWTEGPWSVEDRLEIMADHYATCVAHCYNRIGRKSSLELASESEANAKLIAKSPEMAAMIGELLEELRLIRMKDTNVVYDPTLRARAQVLLSEIGAGD